MADNNCLKLFALSTCVHCKNTRQYLDEKNAPYDCVYVDTLTGDERKEVIEEIRKHNPKLSFPTLVFKSGRVVVGFHKDEIDSELP